MNNLAMKEPTLDFAADNALSAVEFRRSANAARANISVYKGIEGASNGGIAKPYHGAIPRLGC
jgi:hypothetical protein